MNDSLIFDIDGTLWNASVATAKGWNAGLESLGVKQRVTPKGIESVAGNPYETCIDILLPGLIEKYPALYDTMNKFEKDGVEKEGGIFYNKALFGIKKLSKKYPIFILSNCQAWYLEIFLKFSKLIPFIQGYDCHGLANAPKNIMIERMMKKYSLKNPVYIGDTTGDEKSAKLAGVDFIHMSYGFGKLKGSHPSFSSFDKLMNYLEI